MRSRRSVDDWRRAVYRSRTISDAVRVLLLFMADRMTADRKVSVPRSQVANSLGVSERLVTERVGAAHRAGFLDTVVRGQKGRTAVYVGLFPDPQGTEIPYPEPEFRGKHTSPLNMTEIPYPETPFSGNPGVPTITTADRPAGVADRDASSEEKAERTSAVSRLTESGWRP